MRKAAYVLSAMAIALASFIGGHEVGTQQTRVVPETVVQAACECPASEAEVEVEAVPGDPEWRHPPIP